RGADEPCPNTRNDTGERRRTNAARARPLLEGPQPARSGAGGAGTVAAQQSEPPAGPSRDGTPGGPARQCGVGPAVSVPVAVGASECGAGDRRAREGGTDGADRPRRDRGGTPDGGGGKL